MGRIVTLAEAKALPDGSQLKRWAYGALDVTGTLDVFRVLHPRLSKEQARTYAFERALQAPAMSAMIRGTLVNEYERNEMMKILKREVSREEKLLSKLPAVSEVWDVYEKNTGNCRLRKAGKGGKPGKHKWPKGVPDSERTCELCGAKRMILSDFNPGSHQQKRHLFYELHSVPEMTNKTGEVSVDDDVLERIGKKYPALRPLVDAIHDLQDKNKQLGTLGARLSPAGRYHTTLNVGAAWTGRFSSSKNPFGLGGNMQNLTERLRHPFIADQGRLIAYADYMQGESNIVAHLSGDERYLEAHFLGDVHTYVCRLMFPNLPWTGDLRLDKAIAKQLPPWDPIAGHDYRFQTKRIVHGSNYGLTPIGIHMIHPDIPLHEAKRGFSNYMTEFPGIPAWQQHTRARVHAGEIIINPLGRAWLPFGRQWDKKTWRQALAFLPQSTLADIMDIALWLVWYYLEPMGVELLAQVHDAILHMTPQDRLDLEREVLRLMQIPVPVVDIHGVTRTMTIGVESAVGKNWGHKSEVNPLGLAEGPIAAYLKDHPL